MVLFVGDDWAEDHHDVEVQDGTGRRLGKARLPAAEGLRSRVLTFRAAGERDPAVGEVWRCRVLVAEVARTTRRGGLVRINVRAKDLRRWPRRDAVLAAVDAALVEGAVPETYRMHARPARVA